MRVRWLRTALRNLDDEAAYIAKNDPQAAVRTVERIRRAVDRLSVHPEIGRSGRVSGTRELVVPDTPYIIPYRVKADWVEILRVFHGTRRGHGTRRWPKRF